MSKNRYLVLLRDRPGEGEYSVLCEMRAHTPQEALLGALSSHGPSDRRQPLIPLERAGCEVKIVPMEQWVEGVGMTEGTGRVEGIGGVEGVIVS